MNSIKQAMREKGCSPEQIRRFCSRVEQFLNDSAGEIPESEIQPVRDIPKLKELETNPEILGRTAVIKLNGGLGTSMGLQGPKGLLEVKNGKDFYAILLEQRRYFRKVHDFQPPLIFMNSFNTEEETRARLTALGFEQDLPWSFLQSQVPKITEEGELPEGPEEYAWCPPGHGDIYASLLDGGLLEKLRAEGIRYLFVSNIDNLGAVLDSRAPAYMEREGLSFLMEVTRRGENDRKGGHLARSKSGGLLLREVAQCPKSDLEEFQNIEKHRFFNTNNLWIALDDIDESWTELPLIVNRKPLIPQDKSSQQVVQLEQAMGAAIGIVGRAGAVEVERDRFLPVKTTNELLLLRSDLYRLTEAGNLEARTERPPKVSLDPKYFKMIQDYNKRVESVPSLMNCESLTVEGPVTLHQGLDLEGHAHLRAD
ncbi:MAG TPA: UTP--glucose-1-phosphate uridylyltransferase [Phycisphaerales bacterium]|nr:UTP--glucose-1-phosphate uridylyltransferase [Phycisphaerales bacterium]